MFVWLGVQIPPPLPFLNQSLKLIQGPSKSTEKTLFFEGVHEHRAGEKRVMGARVGSGGCAKPLKRMARPERFELPAYGFEVRRSILAKTYQVLPN